MRSFRHISWQLAAITILFGATCSQAWAAPQEGLLDPSIDQPLPQYRSGQSYSVSKPPMKSAPERAPVNTPERTGNSQGAVESNPRGQSNPGGQLELAPNPLTDPGKIEKLKTSFVENPLAAEKKLPGKSGLNEIRSAAPGRESFNPKKLKPVQSPHGSAFQPKPIEVGPRKTVNSEQRPKLKRSTAAKGGSAKKTRANTKKKKSKTAKYVPRQPEIDFEIYRKTDAWPLDPRKQNNPCTQVATGKGCGCQGRQCGSQKQRSGLHGRPYQPHEPGGYRCGKNCPHKRPQYSVYWPRPMSVKFDDCHSGCRAKNLADAFDHLANFRLIDYQRTDNGYCGPGRDPYGCLGESKVAGLGFRIPSVPNDPAGLYPVRQ